MIHFLVALIGSIVLSIVFGTYLEFEESLKYKREHKLWENYLYPFIIIFCFILLGLLI